MLGSNNSEEPEVEESMLSTMHREQCKGQMSLSRACHVGVSEYTVSVDSLRLMFLLVSCLAQSDRDPPQGLCDRLGLVPALGLDQILEIARLSNEYFPPTAIVDHDASSIKHLIAQLNVRDSGSCDI